MADSGKRVNSEQLLIVPGAATAEQVYQTEPVSEADIAWSWGGQGHGRGAAVQAAGRAIAAY